MFKNHIRQLAYTSNFLIMGLPLTKPNYLSAEIEISTLPYAVYGVALWSYSNSNSTGIHLSKIRSIPEAIFKVKATYRTTYITYTVSTTMDPLSHIVML